MRRLSKLRDPNPDLIEMIKKLERRISNLETNSRAGDTSVDRGSLILNTGPENSFQVFVDEYRALEIGSGPDVGNDYGLRLWRDDGTIAFFLGRFGSRLVVGMQDSSLNTIVSNDSISGFGIARPWLAIPFYDDLAFGVNRTTTSSSFENLQRAMYTVQHTFVSITSLVVCSDGSTSGEIIAKINGNLVNESTTSIALGFNATVTQTFSVNRIAFGVDCELLVAARRTAGAGSVGVRVVHAIGRETPL